MTAARRATRRESAFPLALCSVFLFACTALRAPSEPEPRPLRGIPYTERGGESLTLDVYPPAGRTRVAGRAAVLVLHPGGWTRGSKAMVSSAGRALARAGFVAVAADYRLAPEHRFPAQLDDARDAVRWIRRNASDLGVDPDRIGVFGYSSGAHLAALLATQPGEGARVQAAAVGGTPAELLALSPNGAMRALLGTGPREDPRRYVEASPIAHVSSDDPPFYIFHGRLDVIIGIGQARDLRDTLRERGVPAEYRESWLGHFGIFLFQDGGVAGTLDFFQRWLDDPEALAATRERARIETVAASLAGGL